MDRIDKAFDFCADTCKQLITLATGVIAVTATFSTDFVQNVASPEKHLALYAWLAYLASIFCGVWTMLALTGTLQPMHQRDGAEPSINGWNVRLPALLQILAFLIAVGFTITFAFKMIGAGAGSGPPSATPVTQTATDVGRR